ncbi:DUF4265 domain-containing protein [Hamadaea sp. NPDC051192]|uniref:DUF4265 domain-containing protein n=1 Tax=Hamadaea sp. NPDC051192 TaxID=3154940 RepID=UPI003417C698
MRPDRLDEADTDLIKIWIKFVPRDGWLPYDTEGLWAEPLDGHTARVRSIPFLANGIAFGDVLNYTVGEDSTRWASGRVATSGHCTVRVLPTPAGPLGPSAEAVHRCFAPWNLGGEAYSKELPLVALDIPVGADLTGIKSLLDRGVEDGWWYSETACVTDAWRAA